MEDNRDVHQAFSGLFSVAHDCSVHTVARVRDALGHTGRRNVDAAVVDLAYGAETSARLNLIRTWRERGDSFPVIATSANDYEGLSVEALEAGADDFIRKPFRFRELVARIDRQLQRGPGPSSREPKLDGFKLPGAAFTFAGAIVHADLRITMPDGRAEQLTPKQVGILQEFARHSGGVVVRNELVHAVWGADANTNSKSLDQYVYLLRKMFRESGVDLSDFVTPAARVGWHIAADATCAMEGVVKT
ncbi:MAG TPA: response regulator transcription factor [Opitutaceae bacterium]|nr:response regulator transcription factor [Opitutaceae bacterium]